MIIVVGEWLVCALGSLKQTSTFDTLHETYVVHVAFCVQPSSILWSVIGSAHSAAL